MSLRQDIGLISILAPCYNEEQTIPAFVQAITAVLESVAAEYEIIFVDDGSRDNTLNILLELIQTFADNKQGSIRLISLSRNFGKEAALTAAFDAAAGDVVIPIDVDLQDPVELIPQMLEKWRQGADVVLARRKDRQSDSLFKNMAAHLFYKLIAALSHHQIPVDVGDYRLLDRKVVESIRQMPERTRFMKGILSWPGFNTETLEFNRAPRYAGRSHWPFWKLFNHALDGIFSFSTAPLRMWSYIGFALSFVSLLYFLFIVLRTLILGVDVPGYASIVSIILFFSGINLIGLGILGEYVGRIFIEVKQRPIYLIRLKAGFDALAKNAQANNAQANNAQAKNTKKK